MTTAVETVPTGALTGKYTLDPAHSRIGFVARHAMVTKVRGSFNAFVGEGYFDADAPERSSLEITIDATSIDTRNPDRDAHLRSNDFFDMENYPQIRFVSTAVEAIGEGSYRVSGDLTIKAVTRPLSFDLEYTGSAVDPFGNHRVGFEGNVTVNRKDWGISWNAALETGGVLVSERVVLEFEVSAVKAAS